MFDGDQFATFANWLTTLLAALWGAGSMMPIAAQGHQNISGNGTRKTRMDTD